MRTKKGRLVLGFVVGIAALSAVGCAGPVDAPPQAASRSFSIAVIPDTQNYLDYTRQKGEGFAIDSNELFLAQMRDIAARKDIAFVASVGDVWQHQSVEIDTDHASRGFETIPNPFFASRLAPTPRTRTEELPRAIEGYRILAAAGIPFGVAPGNHDYDAMWSASGFPPDIAKNPRELTMTPEDLGMLHIGGLDNFRSVFGDKGEFFRDKPWYIDSYAGGANSAQTFRAGGYSFLHLALEMSAGDDVLAWAASVIEAHPRLPTIITTHDYLDTHGERAANPIVDLKRIDPTHHNSADELFEKLIARHDQVFLVLCGHHHAQNRRVDPNQDGHDVHQILADYQGRGQAGIDAGQPLDRAMRAPWGIGDGWYRLMTFDFDSEPPMVSVQTWSSHYEALSSELPSYASWYQRYEHPELSEAEFLAGDEFTLVLDDFVERFGEGTCGIDDPGPFYLDRLARGLPVAPRAACP